MNINHTIDKNIGIFNISGSVILGAAKDAQKYIIPYTEKPDIQCIIINCCDMDTLDSGGIGMLLGILKNLKKNNKKFFLCSVSREVFQILEITGLDRIFSVFNDIESAVRHCSTDN